MNEITFSSPQKARYELSKEIWADLKVFADEYIVVRVWVPIYKTSAWTPHAIEIDPGGPSIYNDEQLE